MSLHELVVRAQVFVARAFRPTEVVGTSPASSSGLQ